jgi:hypothetical protein
MKKQVLSIPHILEDKELEIEMPIGDVPQLLKMLKVE